MTYFTTSAAVVIKAGRNVNTTASTSAAILQQFITESDAFINTATRHNWASPAPSAAFSSILSQTSSDLAAISLIAYDMSGYTGRGEAESMINVLHDRAMRGINLLKDEKVKEVIT